jgi:hypothetical protein
LEEQVAELECEFDVLGGRDWGLQRGLSIAEPMLRRTRQSLASSPTLAGLYSSLLIPACQSEFPAVRTEVARCLGLFALIDPSGAMAKIVVPLLIKMASFDIFEVQVAAVQAVCDLVMIFPGIQDTMRGGGEEGEGAALSSDPVSIILSFLDGTATDRKAAMGVEDEDEEDEEDEDSAELKRELSVKMTTVAAEGLARLLFNGRTRRADVISELLLLFFSNTVQPGGNAKNNDNASAAGKEDPLFRVRQCLHVFFPEFARSSVDNQRLIEEASMEAFLRLVGPAATSKKNAVAPPIEAFVKFVAFYLQDQGPPMTRTVAAREGETPEETAALKGTCFDDGADANDEEQQVAPLDGASVPLSFHGRLAVGLLSHLMMQEPNGELCGTVCKAVSKLDVPAWDACGVLAVSHMIGVCVEGTDAFGEWDAIAKKSVTRPLKTMQTKMSKMGVVAEDTAGHAAMIEGCMRRLRAKRGDLFDDAGDADDEPSATSKRLSSGSSRSASSSAAGADADGKAAAKKTKKTRRGLKGKTKSNNLLTSSLLDGAIDDAADRRSSSGSARSSIGSPLRARSNNKKSAKAAPSAVLKAAASAAKKKRVSPAFAPAAAAPEALPAPMSLDEENDPQVQPHNSSKAATLLNDIDALLSSDDEGDEF